MLDVAEVNREVDLAYKAAGKSRIPGFRPGKAPRSVLENHFGGKDYFLAQATDELVRNSAPLAVDVEGLVALSSPEFGDFDLAQEGQPFEYTFTLEITPQLELSSYDPIQIELPSAEPTDDEVQERLDSLLEYYVVEDEDGNRSLPELTDAWVKQTLEFDNVEEFKSRLVESIREQKSEDLPALRELRSSQAIAKRLVGAPPESMIKQTEQDNYKDLFQSLQNQRVTLDNYLAASGLSPESFRESMHEQARQSAAMALALDALGRHLGLSASDDEIHEEFVRSGAKDPDALLERWRANGRLSEIRQGLIRIKAAKHAYDTAEVFEPGSLETTDEVAKDTPVDASTNVLRTRPKASDAAKKAKPSARAKVSGRSKAKDTPKADARDTTGEQSASTKKVATKAKAPTVRKSKPKAPDPDKTKPATKTVNQ
jgi:FKBP-type peptidyl-prolyl cis-trans isomerase (trigger factor)